MTSDAKIQRIPAKPYQILAVDDDGDILESIKLILETDLAGVEVRTASSAAQALTMIERRRFDLVLSDFRMPIMDGLEFLQRCKQLAPTMGRILMTAFPDLDMAIRTVNDAKVDAFVVKPFVPAEFVAAVRRFLTVEHARRLQRLHYSSSLEQARKEIR